MTEQKKDCSFCGDADMMILPLRYAVLGCTDRHLRRERFFNLWKNVDDIKIDTTAMEYYTRPLRPGFLYVLIESQGKKSWQAYAVTPGAELYSFPADMPPNEMPTFSCDRETCGVNASMIKIKDASKVNKAWLLFTPDPLTPARLDYLKKNPGQTTAMQPFSPSAWLKGDTEQPHSMSADTLGAHLAEAKIYLNGNKPLIKALFRSLFPPYMAPLEAKQPLTDEQEKNILAAHVGHLKNLQKRLLQNKHPVFVLYDAIGITQEANAWRNQSFEDFNEWLAKREGGKGDASNEHKMHILGQINDLREAIQESIQSIPVDTAALTTEAAAHAAELYRQGYSADEVRKQLENLARLRQKERDRKAKVMTREAWDKVAGEHLDAHKMWKFSVNLDAESAKHDSRVNGRVDAHLAWLQSKQLTDALFVYDPEHESSGLAYSDQIQMAMVGMTYTEAGRAFVGNWIRDIGISASNHLIRAYCYNQTKIIDEMRIALKVAQNGPDFNDPALVSKWFNKDLYGISDSLKVPAGVDKDEYRLSNATGPMAKLAKHFDVIGKAIGEKSNLPWLAGSFAGKGVALQGHIVEWIFGAGMSKGEEKLARAYLGTLSAPLGKLSVKVTMTDLPGFLKDPKKLEAFKQYTQNTTKATLQKAADSWKSGASQAGNWQKDTNWAGGYLRVRTGTVILAIEAFNLLLHAQREHPDTASKMQLTAAAFAVTAAAIEMVGFGFRTVSRLKGSMEVSPHLTIVAKIGYGGTKLVAGAAAITASGIGAYLSYLAAKGMWKEAKDAKTNKGIKYILGFLYGVQGVSQAGFALVSAGTAFADTAEFFAFLSRAADKKFLKDAAGALSRWAAWVNGAEGARKAVLYRFGAFNFWVFIVLTISIWAFEYYNLTELQEWCRRSCFRKPKEIFRKDGSPFDNHELETDALMEALDRTFGKRKEIESLGK